MTDRIHRVRGGCLCGAIRYAFDGPPQVGLLCYCRTCQYVTGGGPAHILAVPREGFELLQGTPTRFATQADSGHTIERFFCGTCGTPLYAESTSNPELRALKVGTLDDPSGFAPRLAIWTSAAQPWAEIPEGLRRFEKEAPRARAPA